MFDYNPSALSASGHSLAERIRNEFHAWRYALSPAKVGDKDFSIILVGAHETVMDAVYTAFPPESLASVGEAPLEPVETTPIDPSEL